MTRRGLWAMPGRRRVAGGEWDLCGGVYAACGGGGAGRQGMICFPMVWAMEDHSVVGVEVTDYYAHRVAVKVEGAAGSVVTWRDGGRIVAQETLPGVELWLGGGRRYQVEVRGGVKKEVRLTMEGRQRVGV